MSVVNAEAQTFALSFRVSELVNQLHCLGQVARHLPHQLKEIVLVKLFWVCQPECYVFVADGVFRVGLELCYFTGSELVDEARVLAPEQPDVIYLKKLHGPSL